MIVRIRLVVAVCAVLTVTGGLLSGCGGEATGPDTTGETPVFGTYILETVDGENLPWMSPVSGLVTIELTAWSFQLDSDQAYMSTTTVKFTETASGSVTNRTDTEVGTFTQSGTTIQFNPEGNGPDQFTGTVSGNTLTLSAADGFINEFVFHR